MNDAREAVTHYLAQLAGPSADDAYHALLDLGRSALPQLVDAFRVAESRDVKLRLAQIVAQGRAAEAESSLVQLLGSPDNEIWKTALDGLVMLGTDDMTARPGVLDSLARAASAGDSNKREWIAEAIQHISELNHRDLG